MFNLDYFLRSSLMGTTLRAAPSKSYAFSTNYHACTAMPTWPRCARPILCWPWPPYNLLPRSCLTLFVDPYWWVPLCVQRPAKSYAFLTNDHACIAMPTWPRCASPILCWPWPPYNLFSEVVFNLGFFSSILTNGHHFGCSAQQNLCRFNKLSCINCTSNMT